jgi:hypothetical protein
MHKELTVLMKISRSIFTVLATAILFLSCKKDSGLSNAESGYYLKFKMKDQWILWRVVTSDIATDPDNEGENDLVIAGQADDNSAALQLRIQMNGGAPITAGDYSSDDRHMPILYLKLTPEFQAYSIGSATGMENAKYVVTISSITDSTVSGHFSGNYLENKLVPDDIVQITEGQFNMLRER